MGGEARGRGAYCSTITSIICMTDCKTGYMACSTILQAGITPSLPSPPTGEKLTDDEVDTLLSGVEDSQGQVNYEGTCTPPHSVGGIN